MTIEVGRSGTLVPRVDSILSPPVPPTENRLHLRSPTPRKFGEYVRTQTGTAGSGSGSNPPGSYPSERVRAVRSTVDSDGRPSDRLVPSRSVRGTRRHAWGGVMSQVLNEFVEAWSQLATADEAKDGIERLGEVRPKTKGAAE